jgi:catechol 2,3-dioxygenase-like lactoylglutathione lyase family enzyme
MHMALRRMDNVGIVVDDLSATIEFFRELGLELEGQAKVEGEWAGRVTGLGDQRVEIAMMRTPDGHGRLELSRFLAPPVVADHRNAPVNALGYLRVMFTVDDVDETLARLRKRGAQLVSSDVVQYEDAYRLCYIRGPGGLLIGLRNNSAERPPSLGRVEDPMPGSPQPNGLKGRFGRRSRQCGRPRVSRSPAKEAVMTHMASTTAGVGPR